MLQSGFHTLLAVVLLTSVACAPRNPSVVQDKAAVAISSMPSSVGTFRLGETQRFPQAELGTLYRYRNDSQLRPDVYVYPVIKGEAGVGTNPAHDEALNFESVLRAQQAQRAFDSFEIIAHRALEYDAGTAKLPGWQVVARLRRGNQAMDSHLHVYMIGDQLLKVRATFPQGSVAPADVEAFVSALLKGVT